MHFFATLFSSKTAQLEFSDFFLSEIKKLNRNPRFIYHTDIEKFDFETYNAALQTIGFEIKNIRPHEFPHMLRYTQDNPAQAIDDLLQLEFIIVDCQTSLSLIQLQYLRLKAGDIAFNKLYNEVFKELDLKLDLTQVLDFFHTTEYDYCVKDTQANIDLSEREVGDWLYVMCNPCAFAYRPTSDSNAWNAVVASTGGHPRLRRFTADDTEDMTLDQIMASMHEEFTKPSLTMLDIYTICYRYHNAPEKTPPHCPLTNKQIFESFSASEQQQITEFYQGFEYKISKAIHNRIEGDQDSINESELERALALALKQELNTPSGIYIPKEICDLPRVGIVQVRIFNEESFGAVLSSEPVPADASGAGGSIFSSTTTLQAAVAVLAVAVAAAAATCTVGQCLI